MLNGSEWTPSMHFHSHFSLPEAGISDRKSGMGCIGVMVHILQKKKTFAYFDAISDECFQFVFSAPFLQWILIFSNDPAILACTAL